MTALAAERDTPRMGHEAVIDMINIPLAASTKVWLGGIVCVNASGYGVPGSATAGLVVVGKAEKTVDNTGSAGAKSVEVLRGTFRYANSSGDDLIGQSDWMRPCYLVDDQTVARTGANGTRPVAGRVIRVESTGVWVELGVGSDEGVRSVDLLLEAAADLSSSQYLFVEMNTDGDVTVCNAAGEDAIGVLQNAPASGAIAIVRVSGVSRVIASGAINPGVLVATTNAGKSKAAVKATTDTSDAGGAADALVSSYVMGRALTLGATDTQHSILVQPMGAIPTTAA